MDFFATTGSEAVAIGAGADAHAVSNADPTAASSAGRSEIMGVPSIKCGGCVVNIQGTRQYKSRTTLQTYLIWWQLLSDIA
jgi:hypothetical protein